MTDPQRIPRLTPKGQAHPAGGLAAALAGEGSGALSAPAHPFDEATGGGIKWTPGALELWLKGERLDVAEVETESPVACWRALAFVSAFPTVTHWWFGSPWTQRVRVTATAHHPDESRVVWLQAVQEDADELPWIVQADGSAGGPLPEYAGGTANEPLRLRLGHLSRLVLAGQIAVGQWAAVTSLVAAHELPALLEGDRRDELLRAVGLL
jgi:hypothetical protein